MNKEIQGPGQQQLNGQIKLSSEDAIQKHVAQFWDPRHHDEIKPEPINDHHEYLPSPIELLKGTISAIDKADTIRGVKRAASEAYVKGAKGAPLQTLVQKLVRERKTELRSARGDQKPRQEMSW